MSLMKLAWRNVFYKPLNMVLTLILFGLGMGLIVFLLLVNDQIKENFDKNLAGIDMVIGAKGSPLQMILCNMYHIDNPTGNISINDARAFLSPQNPLIKTAVPLSLGDSYRGFRIVGTNHEFVHLYDGSVQEGELFNNDFEVTIGRKVANDLGLVIGSKFESTHGFVDDVDMGHDHGSPFEVVSILESSGTVLDHLIICNTSSIWHVHHNGEDETSTSDSGIAEFNLLDHPNQDITSILVKFKNRTNFRALNLPRNINQNTPLQAASPAIEMNRLYDLIGVGVDTIRNLAFLIAFVSGISIFISLYNTLKDRKHELALMRVSGSTPMQLFSLILLEGIILAIFGSILGIIVGHIGIGFFGDLASDRYNYSFTVFKFLKTEWFLFFASIILGMIAAIIPAILAYKTEIHKTLQS